MPRSHLISAAACLLLIAGCAAPVPQSSGHSDYPDVQASPAGKATCYATSQAQNAAAVSATNATRKANGLAALTPDPVLAAAAAHHACDMAERGLMSHTGTTTKGPLQRVKAQGGAPRLAAENIAAGPFGQDRVLKEWAASNGHLANILIPQLRHYGIGRAVGSDGKTVFWAAVYTAPR